MIRRTTTLLLIALTPATLADEASSYTQIVPVHQSPDTGERQELLPAPIANGAVNVTDSVQLATHEQPLPLPLAATDQGVNPISTEPVATSNQSAEAPPADNARLLRRGGALERQTGEGPSQASPPESPLALLASDAATTAVAATALVVGLFLVCAWVLKRGMPKSSRVLPREAVELLGRCPLGNKQFGQLLHVGNKVILVNVTANGAETLVEVDDPNEVVRILGACAASGPGSATKEFDAIFQQLAKEPTPRGFIGEESPSYSAATSAYSQSAQGGRRG